MSRVLSDSFTEWRIPTILNLFYRYITHTSQSVHIIVIYYVRFILFIICVFFTYLRVTISWVGSGPRISLSMITKVYRLPHWSQCSFTFRRYLGRDWTRSLCRVFQVFHTSLPDRTVYIGSSGHDVNWTQERFSTSRPGPRGITLRLRLTVSKQTV